MNCPHANTTTLLWLYDNEHPEHIEHITQCAECEAVVAKHSDLVTAISPTLGHLSTHSRPAPPVTHGESPARAYATWTGLTMAVVAMAAVWMLTMTPPSTPSDFTQRPQTAHQTAIAVEAWMDRNVDDELSNLDAELTELSVDLLTL